MNVFIQIIYYCMYNIHDFFLEYKVQYKCRKQNHGIYQIPDEL